MSPSPYWRRSFNSRSVSFFEGNDSTLTDIAIVRDLEAVRDILDESKDCVLPLETIVTKSRMAKAVERLCWATSALLISWLAWAAMNAARSAPG